MPRNCKLVVFVPLTHAEVVRDALARAGAGMIGEYKDCSFSSRGMGRFTPMGSARPAIGELGVPSMVEEERIEVRVAKEALRTVIDAMLAAHPYDEVAYDVYPLIDTDEPM